ncbi:MAG: transglutaminase domain-containing protein [Proteobacteria bacterium]|nr:transglutaminase domain-containing protein [Pseudomonadota bacterium]
MFSFLHVIGLCFNPEPPACPAEVFCIRLSKEMEMKRLLGAIFGVILSAILSWALPARAENYTIRGDMRAEIRYELRERITGGTGVRETTLSVVIPESFKSPTFRQEVRDVDLAFVPRPDEQKKTEDGRGNRIITAAWNGSPAFIDVRLTVNAVNTTGLETIETTAPFPLGAVTGDLRDYLRATEQVQSDHPQIRALAGDLTRGVATQFDAVQRLISWVVDHVSYVNPPLNYDALYSLESGKGNCQNFSHLSAALLRAVGIPVRIVNGMTLNRPFDVAWQQGVMTFKMGQGRHSWIEVWFPDLGWVPFDPQNSELFVSSRFIRVEVGVDNNETKNDGLLRWTQAPNAVMKPRLQETLSADFLKDHVSLRGNREAYGPRNLLLCPSVRASFQPLAIKPLPPPPVYTEAEKRAFLYELPFVYGNLEFPEDVDFAFPRVTRSTGGDAFEMPRNFLVETAEYVTTNLTQYAQVVILQKPLRLDKVGLALHNFGGGGWLWVDLFADRDGKPGPLIGASALVNLDEISTRPGYRWVDFDFSRENPVLMPGAYWIALGFSGSPVVNWFYTYGKPVGPVHGTRYKGVFAQDWSGALNYEFNYRLSGRTVK